MNIKTFKAMTNGAGTISDYVNFRNNKPVEVDFKKTNMLELEDMKSTVEGVTMVVKDGVITVNGTSTASGEYTYLYPKFKKPIKVIDDFTVMRCFCDNTNKIAGQVAFFMEIERYDHNLEVYFGNGNSNIKTSTAKKTGEINLIRLVINRGTTVNNATITPYVAPARISLPAHVLGTKFGVDINPTNLFINPTCEVEEADVKITDNSITINGEQTSTFADYIQLWNLESGYPTDGEHIHIEFNVENLPIIRPEDKDNEYAGLLFELPNQTIRINKIGHYEFDAVIKGSDFDYYCLYVSKGIYDNVVISNIKSELSGCKSTNLHNQVKVSTEHTNVKGISFDYIGNGTYTLTGKSTEAGITPRRSITLKFDDTVAIKPETIYNVYISNPEYFKVTYTEIGTENLNEQELVNGTFLTPDWQADGVRVILKPKKPLALNEAVTETVNITIIPQE